MNLRSFFRRMTPLEKASDKLAETRREIFDAELGLETAQALLKLLKAREVRLRAFISSEMEDAKLQS